MTDRLDQRRLEKLITSFGQLRLLVVGDVMLDEYLWGDVERVSPEAPVPVVHVRTRVPIALGGAGNVVREHVVALGGQSRILLRSSVGNDCGGPQCGSSICSRELGVDPGGRGSLPRGRPTHAQDTSGGAFAADRALRSRDATSRFAPPGSRRPKCARCCDAALPGVRCGRWWPTMARARSRRFACCARN